ncbi:SMI1/KNR4 family protein [Chryseobacterium aquaticum]|uniref:SMI1/KNR4 family protein n=1 Tax=Chryseobacterium aquaticum TaxID=452084 RepID=UPI003F71847D
MNQFILTKQSITEAELSLFEQGINLSLPESYKKHILQYNGGCPEEKDCFKGARVAHFYSIKYGQGNIEKVMNDFINLLPEKFLAFAYDGGGNPFCFDLSNGNNYGKVYYCPMDMGDVKPEFLANSFKEFMDGLTEDCDY